MCSTVDLSLESPTEAALLLSLAGVKCYYGNQWHCSPTENAEKMKLLFIGEYFLLFGKILNFVILLSCLFIFCYI